MAQKMHFCLTSLHLKLHKYCIDKVVNLTPSHFDSRCIVYRKALELFFQAKMLKYTFNKAFQSLLSNVNSNSISKSWFSTWNQPDTLKTTRSQFFPRSQFSFLRREKSFFFPFGTEIKLGEEQAQWGKNIVCVHLILLLIKI